jgi:hypothetical protein
MGDKNKKIKESKGKSLQIPKPKKETITITLDPIVITAPRLYPNKKK